MLSIYFVLFFSHSSDLFYCLSPLTKATALSRLLAAFREHSYCAQLFLFFFFFRQAVCCRQENNFYAFMC